MKHNSLFNSDRDDYGKECLDQINAFLSEEKGKTIMIMAGYEDDINTLLLLHYFYYRFNNNSGCSLGDDLA